MERVPQTVCGHRAPATAPQPSQGEKVAKGVKKQRAETDFYFDNIRGESVVSQVKQPKQWGDSPLALPGRHKAPGLTSISAGGPRSPRLVWLRH